MQATLNAWNIFFVICASQGLLFSVLLWLKPKSLIQNIKLLSIIMGLFSIMLFYYVIYWSGLQEKLHRIVAFPLVFTWLIGPLNYLYVKSLGNEKPSKWPHFVLPVVVAIYFVANAFTGIWRNATLFDSPLYDWWSLLMLIQMTTYAWVILRNHSKKSSWHNLVGMLYGGYVFGNIIYYVLVWTGLLTPAHDYFVSLFIAAFIYTIGYYGYREESLEKKKYTSSDLTPNALKFLANKLEEVMTEKKPHLDHDLNLEKLAQEVGITKHQLSRVINECFGVNFFDFVNQTRIKEAQIILSSHEDIKINQLAFKVGFNNKATFNNAFKKVTGKSPSIYKKSLLDAV